MDINIIQGENYHHLYGRFKYNWDPYMKQLAQHCDEWFFIHDIGHFSADSIHEWVEWNMFATAMKRNPIVILNAHNEGPSWMHIKRTVDRMVSEYGMDPRRIILWSGSVAEGNEPIIIATTYFMFVYIIDENDIVQQPVPTHHYAMLARIPRTSRVKTAVEILERGLDVYGKMSCGSGNYRVLTREPYDKYVPAKWQDRFPMLLDGYIMNSDTRQYTGPLQLTEITGAFCQIIPESSHEWAAPGWTAPFLTEKTAKCMLMKQVPIWIGAIGQAKMARDLGFDLFDDLIDHSYDTEVDPDRRLIMAVDQLERLCRMPLLELQQYRAAHAERFDRNYQLFLHMKYNLADLEYKTLLSALDKCNTK